MKTIQRVMLKNTIQNQDRTFKNVQVTNKKGETGRWMRTKGNKRKQVIK